MITTILEILMNASVSRTLISLAFAGTLGTLPGCIVQDLSNNIDGGEIRLSCQLDAFFNIMECKPGGRLNRRKSSTATADLSQFTVQLSASGGSLVSLPASVDITIYSGGAPIATNTFALQVNGVNTVILSDPCTASAWLNSYGAAVDAVEYSMSTVPVTAVVGTNSITHTAVVGGGVFGSATYSTYISSLRSPEQP
jgi:hypothetical protein